MHKPHHSGPPVDPDELRKLGFERRDIGLKVIAKWVVGFFIFGAVSIIIAAITFQVLVPDGISRKPDFERRRVPPEPRLQDNVTAKLDMFEMRHNENELLQSYGWVDKERGIIRIPIDQAIDMAAQGVRPTSSGVAPNPDQERKPASAQPPSRTGDGQ